GLLSSSGQDRYGAVAPPCDLARNASYNCAGPSRMSFRPARTRSEPSACVLMLECASRASMIACTSASFRSGELANCAAGEQRRAVEHDAEAAAAVGGRAHLGEQVQQEQHGAVGHARQA